MAVIVMAKMRKKMARGRKEEERWDRKELQLKYKPW